MYWRQDELEARGKLGESLRTANPWLSWFGTAVICLFLLNRFDRPMLAGIWGVLGTALLGLGAWRNRLEIRLQALVVGGFALSEGLMTGLVPEIALPVSSAYRVISMVVAASGVLAMAVLAEKVRPAGRRIDRFEALLPFFYSYGGAALLAYMFSVEFEWFYLTVCWGAQGLAMVVAGLLLKQRMLRYPGLTLLILCTVKIAIFDLTRLELEYRMLAYIGLGIALVLTSLAYARFRSRTAGKVRA
jgi:hypothetical protein